MCCCYYFCSVKPVIYTLAGVIVSVFAALNAAGEQHREDGGGGDSGFFSDGIDILVKLLPADFGFVVNKTDIRTLSYLNT
jgi:hypothetical protein